MHPPAPPVLPLSMGGLLCEPHRPARLPRPDSSGRAVTLFRLQMQVAIYTRMLEADVTPDGTPMQRLCFYMLEGLKMRQSGESLNATHGPYRMTKHVQSHHCLARPSVPARSLPRGTGLPRREWLAIAVVALAACCTIRMVVPAWLGPALPLDLGLHRDCAP